MNPLEAYLDRLHEIHAGRRGTPELSYRAALENLLNAVGAQLDPEVQATAELADTGAGRPDYGLIETKSGILRGVVEVKPLAEEQVNMLHPATGTGSHPVKVDHEFELHPLHERRALHFALVWKVARR